MKPKILVLVFYLFALTLFAQNNVNGYKYLIVPKQFDFQKAPDKHQLNSLTMFLFKKEGFNVLYEGDDLPKDLYDNPCLGLKVNALNTSGMLTTKLIIELLDCRNTKVFTSSEGKSKIKDFKRAFHEALRRAFQSVKSLNYRYDNSLTIEAKNEVKEDKETTIPLVEGETLKAEVENANGEEMEFNETDTVEEVKAEEIIEKEEKIIPVVEKSTEETTTVETILYAQKKAFGYQLVDSTPSVVFLLQKSSIKDVFILKNKNGIVFKKNDQWIAEYYEDGVLLQKELQVKF